MKKKISAIFMIIVAILVVPFNAVSAQSSKIQFLDPDNELVFETNYSIDDYYLKISSNDDKVVYNIFDNDGNWKESWTFDKENNDIKPFAVVPVVKRYTNSKDIGALSGRLMTEVAVEYYDEGSIYKQFNKLVGKTYWVSGWSYFNLDRNASWMAVTPINPTNRGVWPSVGLEIEGSFIVSVQLSAEANVQFGKLLFSGGFSSNGSLYYTKHIPVSYTIKLHSGW